MGPKEHKRIPLYFFLKRYVKSKVYVNGPATIKTLKDIIRVPIVASNIKRKYCKNFHQKDTWQILSFITPLVERLLF